MSTLIPTKRKPRGIKRDAFFFDEEKVTSLMLEYQRTRDAEVFKMALLECINLVDAMILDDKYRFDKWEGLETVRNECMIKLHYVLEKWDVARGNCYSLFNRAILNFLFSYAQRQKRHEAFRKLCDHELPE